MGENVSGEMRGTEVKFVVVMEVHIHVSGDGDGNDDAR